LNLAGATVAITAGLFTGDVLFFTSRSRITGTHGGGSCDVCSSGLDTLAHYQAALRGVTFSAGENPTNYGSDITRTITWTVDDGRSEERRGGDDSTVSITSVNDAQALSGTSTASYNEEGPAVAPSGG